MEAMLFRNPRKKLDAKLQARIASLDISRDGVQHVHITVECQKGLEEAVADAVRRDGGTVFDVIPAFHLVAAEIGIGQVMSLAESRAVREVNLAGRYLPA